MSSRFLKLVKVGRSNHYVINGRSLAFAACVMACTVFAAPQLALASSALSVTVTDARGAPLAGVVVVAQPDTAAPKPPPGQKAVMDQRNLEFTPDVLVVQSGTAVEFPTAIRCDTRCTRFRTPRISSCRCMPDVGTNRWCSAARPGDNWLDVHEHSGRLHLRHRLAVVRTHRSQRQAAAATARSAHR